MDIWYKNVYEVISHLANIDYQNVVWMGRSETYASSFIESLSLLFDSFWFEDFIEKELKPKKELSRPFLYEIEKLRDDLNFYDDKGNTDAQILEDPEWLKVVEQAKKVKSLWENELGIPEGVFP